jgi:hypothetical protein
MNPPAPRKGGHYHPLMEMRLGPFREPIVHTEDMEEETIGTYRLGAGIKIKPGLNPTVEANTLVHEGLHMVLGYMELNWDNEDEENFVKKMAPWLQMWVFQNPEMWQHILDLMNRTSPQP